MFKQDDLCIHDGKVKRIHDVNDNQVFFIDQESGVPLNGIQPIDAKKEVDRQKIRLQLWEELDVLDAEYRLITAEYKQRYNEIAVKISALDKKGE